MVISIENTELPELVSFVLSTREGWPAAVRGRAFMAKESTWSFTYLHDHLISIDGLELFKSLKALTGFNPAESRIKNLEFYNEYLGLRHPTYSYH